MNIFLPYEEDIEASIASLDDVRLNKQILEMKILLDGARKYEKGEVSNGYFRHPVAQFYKDNPEFLTYYGFKCCEELWFRKNVYHQYYDYFEHLNNNWYKITEPPAFTPYYMSGSKNTPDCIRTTYFVSELFKTKLIAKWLNDKREPKWSIRGKPKFFVAYLSLSEAEQYEFWEKAKYIEERVKGQ